MPSLLNPFDFNLDLSAAESFTVAESRAFKSAESRAWQVWLDQRGLSRADYNAVLTMLLWSAPKLTSAQQGSLLTLFLLLLSEQRQGSTCLRLHKLTTLPSEVPACVTLPTQGWLSFISRLIKAGLVDTLVGTTGDYRPWIFEKKNAALFVQKMQRFEIEVARLIHYHQHRQLSHPSVLNIRQACLELLGPLSKNAQGNGLRLAEEQIQSLVLAIYSPVMIISGGPGTGKTSLIVLLIRLLHRLQCAQSLCLAAPTGKAAKRMSQAVAGALQSLDKTTLASTDQELLAAPPQAQTLHRLLNYSPSRRQFLSNEYNPLEHDCVIIDECSMIDVELMTYLLRALTPLDDKNLHSRRIYLIGDARQLPSVAAGAVFKDMSEWGGLKAQVSVADLQSILADLDTPMPTACSAQVSLKRTFRQRQNDIGANQIIQFTQLLRQSLENLHSPVLQGELFESAAITTPAQNLDQFKNLSPPTALSAEAILKSLTQINLSTLQNKAGLFWLVQDNTEANLNRFYQWWLDEVFPKSCWQDLQALAFQPDPQSAASDLDPQGQQHATALEEMIVRFQQQQILAFVKNSVCGVEQINDQVQRLLTSHSSAIQAGTPLMIHLNDYDQGLFNGDQGLAFLSQSEGEKAKELRLAFPTLQGLKTFAVHQLQDIKPSYAITVHKSQGSEYEQVAIILPAQVSALSHLEVLYTAITRAKKSVFLVGSAEVLLATLQRSSKRHTLLQDRLVENS